MTIENKEKFTFNVTVPLGVPLLDGYLSCIKAFTEELSKYEEVELIDDYGLMQLFESSRKSFPPQSVENNLIQSIKTQLDLEYNNIKQYCPDLTFETFLRDNKWICERDIQNYLDYKRKIGINSE